MIMFFCQVFCWDKGEGAAVEEQGGGMLRTGERAWGEGAAVGKAGRILNFFLILCG